MATVERVQIGWVHPLFPTVHDHDEAAWQRWHPAVREAIEKRHSKCRKVYA